MRLADLVRQPDRFFDSGDPPLQQGDVVLAPVVRVQTDAARVDRWRALDQAQASIHVAAGDLLDLVVHAGYGPVMIVTHDCHMDREFLAEVSRLRQADRRLALADAESQAESDPDLDRFFQVCPLLPVDAVATQWGSIASGEAIGLFPVAEDPDKGLRAPSIVDLTHRSTIDRGTIVRRLNPLSEAARAMLRFALARYDVFRTPQIGYDLEAAVGRRIRRVEASPTSPLLVRLEFDDGSDVELVQQPAEIRGEGSARSQVPGEPDAAPDEPSPSPPGAIE